MKLSHSSVNLFTECGRRYKYHYIDKLRERVRHGALLYGSAYDEALNYLLKNFKTEPEALNISKDIFYKNFLNAKINNDVEYIPTSLNVVYSKTDFDGELLLPEDIQKFELVRQQIEFKEEISNISDFMAFLIEKKSEYGLKGFSKQEQTLYALGHWLCLLRKGYIMLDSYYEEVLPKIKEVFALQKYIKLENNQGDEITGIIDLIAELSDGKRYILDNKTTASMNYYESDSAMRSQQLIIYFHSEKEEYKLDGVGFIVAEKAIRKNKTKICSQCGNDGSGGRFKTCEAEIDGSRCNGSWNIKINPKANIELILNPVPEAAEQLVIETFDKAAEGIRQEIFGPNLKACKNGNLICPYYNKCWNGSDEDLVDMKRKKTNE